MKETAAWSRQIVERNVLSFRSGSTNKRMRATHTHTHTGLGTEWDSATSIKIEFAKHTISQVSFTTASHCQFIRESIYTVFRTFWQPKILDTIFFFVVEVVLVSVVGSRSPLIAHAVREKKIDRCGSVWLLNGYRLIKPEFLSLCVRVVHEGIDPETRRSEFHEKNIIRHPHK